MKTKNGKKGVRTAVIIFLSGILLSNLITVFFTAAGLRSRLRWLPCAFLTVESGSMEPLMSPGDLLFVWETPYSQLQAGDIISYHSGTGFITHQIVRRTGDCLVTKGSANRLEDEPIGQDLYYGRVLFVIPSVGVYFGYISDPVKALFEISVIFSLFYGFSAIKYLDGLLINARIRRSVPSSETAERPSAGRKHRKIKNPVKLLICLSLSSVLAISPCMTAAKYTAKINEYFSISTSASYFTSNLLSEAGDHYSIKGWNGQAYNLVLETKNYSNTLLANKEGIDTVFAIYLEPVSGDGFKSGEYYELSAVPSANATLSTDPENFPYPVTSAMTIDLFDVSLFTDSDYSGADLPELSNGGYISVPYVMYGDDTGSIQDFNIQVCPSSDPAKVLNPGDKIRFNAYAFTCPDRGFYRVLKGTFVMQLATSGTFLAPPVMGLTDGSVAVSYRIQTNLVSSADSSTKVVLISWDASKVSLNEYEPTAFNLIYNNAHNIYAPENADGRGTLTINLEPYSSIDLQFFKISADTEVTDQSISVAVVQDGAIVEGSLAAVSGE